MSGFILEYGTEAGEHVTVFAGGPVEYYKADTQKPEVFTNLDTFHAAHPMMLGEMVKNKVLKPRK